MSMMTCQSKKSSITLHVEALEERCYPSAPGSADPSPPNYGPAHPAAGMNDQPLCGPVAPAEATNPWDRGPRGAWPLQRDSFPSAGIDGPGHFEAPRIFGDDALQPAPGSSLPPASAAPQRTLIIVELAPLAAVASGPRRNAAPVTVSNSAAEEATEAARPPVVAAVPASLSTPAIEPPATIVQPAADLWAAGFHEQQSTPPSSVLPTAAYLLTGLLLPNQPTASSIRPAVVASSASGSLAVASLETPTSEGALAVAPGNQGDAPAAAAPLFTDLLTRVLPRETAWGEVQLQRFLDALDQLRQPMSSFLPRVRAYSLLTVYFLLLGCAGLFLAFDIRSRSRRRKHPEQIDWPSSDPSPWENP
jgi:hypothetical protein